MSQTTYVQTSTIGFPRIGPNRELKKALESFWSDKSSEQDLLSTVHEIEALAWKAQADAGIDMVACDGTLYDQTLDIIHSLGLLPERFNGLSGLEAYFAAARGGTSLSAMDMSKFFDTNYHYIVPELNNDSQPRPDWCSFIDRVSRCQKAIGTDKTVPLIAVGPISLVFLSKGNFNRSEMITRLIPAYTALLAQLKDLNGGVKEVQIHEPVLATSQASSFKEATEQAYQILSGAGVPLHLVIPFDDVTEETYSWVTSLPVSAIGLDFCSVPGNLAGNNTARLIAKKGFPKDKRLGAGIIDGRSVWADDGTATGILAGLRKVLGDGQAISVQSSTSLQFLPLDLTLEKSLPADVYPKLAFAKQKLDEIVAVSKTTSASPIDLSSYDGKPKKSSDVVSKIPGEWFSRQEPYSSRRSKQVANPPLATTTIGSFPQTPSIRQARLKLKKGIISAEEYNETMAAEIGYAIGVQDAIGLDVLVHGEPERTDMVEYFGRVMNGFIFTEYAWVQSYGSRCVRPPIIAGDVSRSSTMTVKEYKIAQSVTSKPVKGMLTGPVTILNWSFPRKDIPRSDQAYQIGLALREEVADLEQSGCRVLQMDEPAIREGLPLKAERCENYLKWATSAFRLATSSATSQLQIVSHLCYSSFEDIMAAIDSLDADVLTIENSRSDDEMIHAMANYGYVRDLGPGVYDVHSPAVPTVEFMAAKIRTAIKSGVSQGDASRIWVNPDCGLKTRKWHEVVPALINMVAAAKLVRKEMGLE